MAGTQDGTHDPETGPGRNDSGNDTASGIRHWGVGRRLAAMIVLALLPLGLMAMQQTASVVREVSRGEEMAAMGATVQAAAPQIAVIQKARSSAATLAALVGPYIDDLGRCRRIMDDTLSTIPEATVVAYIPLSGDMMCASGGRMFDFAGNPHFERLIERPEPALVINPRGPVSGTAVLGIAHPVFDRAGVQTGVVTVSLRHEAVGGGSDAPGSVENGNAAGGAAEDAVARPVALITFDRGGNILAANIALDDAALTLPRDVPLADLALGGSQTMTGRSVSNPERLYSVVPMADDLFLLGVWRVGSDEALVNADIAPYVLPGLMWLAALAVAVFAAEHLVTGHVRQISLAMLAFAKGDRGRHELKLSNPPAEIADLCEAYDILTTTILRDEAELENLVHQKDMLLREVHHRTGNSLQLIASVLRMHLREQPDEATRRLLENLHSRVMSLSTVHLGLYRIAGSQSVAVHDLMTDVITKVRSIHERFASAGAIEARLAPVEVPTDQAVPLALLLAEILSCFPASEAYADDPPILVELSRCDEGKAMLRISGPADAAMILNGERSDAPAKIAARLIRAFVEQLSGSLAIDRQERKVVADVKFRVREA